MLEITTEEQYYNFIASEKESCIFFTTDWCRDCIPAKAYVPELEGEFSSINFAMINRDKLLDICQDLEIMGIPSFVNFKEGKEIKRFVSGLAKSKEEVKAYLKE